MVRELRFITNDLAVNTMTLYAVRMVSSSVKPMPENRLTLQQRLREPSSERQNKRPNDKNLNRRPSIV